MALYGRLPPDLQRKLHGLINIFLDEKKIFGQGGLEVTETMRIVIAAQACVMLLNRDADVYPGFTTILVYPDTYVAVEQKYDGLVNSTRPSNRSGESWFRGPVVLSWRDTVVGMDKRSDGQNVVLHEFAHKLDEEDGRMDGLPLLEDAQEYQMWASVLSSEYTALRESVERRHETVMDEYGASSPAEFFAVATETFFEKPHAMKEKHPALFEELEQFYRLDPTEWDPDPTQ